MRDTPRAASGSRACYHYSDLFSSVSHGLLNSIPTEMSRKSSTSSDDTIQPPPYREIPPHQQPSSLIPEHHVRSDVESAEKKIRYPFAVFFIVVNEFCERFSYYGMRTVLTLYLRDILLFNENDATVMYHVFVMLCYFTPICGAILADTYLGKFKTILYLSILYACGNIILSVSAIPNTLPQKEFSLIGLFVIAVGTGGIKPCVSAFGGDQFVRPQQDKQLEQFFSIFYFAINAGSLISTILTPILREDVKCFNQSTCFPLAFGVPAILMIVAVVVFVAGKPNYTMKKPEGNIMGKFVTCVGRALKKKISSKGEKHNHWLEYASDKYDKQLIEDIKRVLTVLVLYIPIPFFWALFDQQGSRWTFQATRMDGTLGSTTIKPDQMQVVNPLLILILVPIFESLIYPLFTKCGLLTPLQRITVGGILAGIAFVISGFVELSLESTYPIIPSSGFTQLNFINTLPCHIKFKLTSDVMERNISIDTQKSFFQRDLPILDGKPLKVTNVQADCQSDANNYENVFTGKSEEAFAVLITTVNNSLSFVEMKTPEPLDKSSNGDPRVGFIFDWGNAIPGNGVIRIKAGKEYKFNTTNVVEGTNIGRTEIAEIELGEYEIFIPSNGKDNNEISIRKINFKQGGCYSVVIQHPKASGDYLDMTIEVTPANSVHMLLLIPQYLVMTIAEVMFSVTGLQFSFTQAPSSMRSVMQALWQLTVAFGNLIVIIIAEAKFMDRQSMEFFLFAGLMGADMIIFMLLAMRYTYVDSGATQEEKKVPLEQQKSDGSTKKGGLENKGFSDTEM